MANDMERAEQVPLRKPWLLEFRSSGNYILATICVAIFTDAFLYAVVVPVLPFSLHERSGVPEDEVQWWNSFIFGIFGFAIIVGSPVCGWVTDHTSNRSTSYFVGLFVLGAATLLFGYATSAWVLVISRVLQGFSAAIVYTVGLALLVDTVGGEKIGQWMGTAMSMSSFGLIIAPLFGGVVYHRAGYMAVFLMILGLIIVDIVMRLFMIEKKHAQKYLKSSPTNEASGYTTFSNDHTDERINGATHQSTDYSTPRNEDLLAIPEDNTRIESNETTALLSNKKSNHKSKPAIATKAGQLPTIIVLLLSPRVSSNIYGIFVNVSIQATFDGVLPLFVKNTFHWNSLDAGLIYLCLAIPALAGPFVGQLSDRFGPRWIAVLGCALTSIPLFLMRLVEENNTQHKVLLGCLLVLTGFTNILIVAPVAADLSTCVEKMEEEQPGIFGPGGAYGQVFALFNCSMAAATMFGPIVAGAISEQYGWKAMTVAMGIFSISGAIPTFFFTGGKRIQAAGN
ncbi:putative MFS-type transporter [Lachnellula willkommii]|uniref:Putative MFS-type transporter n=1 Tax=Lachnellula willkommii TaxID=215461 RepID=A0A559MMY1_9HELO|nr:putative MFS-type transporter [Lachnellula willkommii]